MTKRKLIFEEVLVIHKKDEVDSDLKLEFSSR